jgi:uncharacterized membrane protein YbaN (DUF454 family)
MEIRKTISLQHATIYWLIGLITGVVICILGTRYEGLSAVAFVALAVFVSRKTVQAYKDWEMSKRSEPDES